MSQTNGVNGLHKEAERLHLDASTNGTGSITASRANQRKKLDRKQSSPMMPAFMVSAPGKVIVFGEHAVVHGKVRDGGHGKDTDAVERILTYSVGRHCCRHLSTILPAGNIVIEI
jgi:hypothetical protein